MNVKIYVCIKKVNKERARDINKKKGFNWKLKTIKNSITL